MERQGQENPWQLIGSGTAGGGGGTQTQGRVKIDGHPRLLSDFCILVPHAPMYVHMTAEHRRLMFASP